jgi:tetratricopeptide (TPR) repeat protein
VIEILLDENDTVIPGSDHTETSRKPVLAILAYRSQLVKNTYCTDPTQLRKALPGAVCLGLIREINDISHRSSDGEKQYLAQADALTTALSDLVDCCDLLVLNDYSTALNFAKNYINCGQTLRAQAILQKLLHKNSEDADVLQLLGQILEFDLDLDGAIEFYQKAVSLRPDDWVLHKDLGIAMLGKLEFDGGISSLQRALDQAPDNPDLLNEIKRAETLRKWLQDAALDDVMPTIAPCDEELAEGQFREESLALAEHLYHKHGTLHISNVFDIAMINDCKTQFVDEYKNYLGDQKQDDALQIGHRRFQVSIALHGSFNQPDFYANPFVLGIIKRLVGQDAIIGSTVCATSLPGSKDQHLHKDHRALFTVDEYDKPITIPPVSITTMIPLVSLTKENGTTLVKKGSHRLGTAASDKLADQVPLVPAGSCFLMDLALSHQGMGNQTDQVRPIINMVYHRRWFADNKNFKKQPPLQIKSAEFAKIPKQHRQLFDWCIQPGPQVNF